MEPTGRCCVFQPFDNGGPYDKRYRDTIAPAVEGANLEPYRVDRDDKAIIPIETLHEEIKTAELCLADISTRNPNVMYELGYAIASDKDVVLICSVGQSEKFPFDIQHRGIITYASESISDFDNLRQSITSRIKALRGRRVATQVVVSSPVKDTEGLQSSEVAALALIMANVDSLEEYVNTSTIKRDMEKAGYTRLATQLALSQLSRMLYVESRVQTDYNENTYTTYRILTSGESWLLSNQDKLELRLRHSEDDDIPF